MVAEARRAYDEGRRLFEARQFTDALRNFERAYSLRTNPIALIPIANCHEQMGNFRDAVATLERYLRDRADAPDRAEVEARIATMRPRIATQTAASPGTGAASTGTSTAINSSATASTAAANNGTANSATGSTSATATAGTGTNGAANSATNTTTNATTATQTASDPNAGAATATTATDTATQTATDTGATATDVAPLPPPPARGISPAVWVCAGLTGAGVVAGSVLGFLALGDHASYNTAPTRDLKNRGETYALLADLSFATAILSGFVGTVVFFSDRAEANRAQAATALLTPSERSRRASRPRAFIVPNGVSVSW